MKKPYGRLLTFAAIAVTLAEPSILAQQAATTPAFEVVSIRPSGLGAGLSWQFLPNFNALSSRAFD